MRSRIEVQGGSLTITVVELIFTDEGRLKADARGILVTLKNH